MSLRTNITDVCVIGAGFSGLSTAHKLKKHGLTSIVLDAGDRLGEKTRSITIDGNTIELGTCYTSFDYTNIFELASELGVTRSEYGKTSSYRTNSVAAPLFSNPDSGLGLFESQATCIADYCKKWPTMLKLFDAGDPETVEALSRPVDEWLRSCGDEDLLPIFSIMGDGFGYGPINRVPAVYVIRFVSIGIIQSLATNTYWRLETFEHILTQLAQSLEVQSQSLVSGGRFDVESQLWTLQIKETHVTSKHVVVACPPISPALLGMMDPARRFNLTNKLSSTPYMCAAVRVHGWFEEDNRSMLGSIGGLDQLCFARRDTPLRGGTGYYACFAMLSDPNADVHQIIADDVACDGGTLLEVLQANIYPNYNTHFIPSAILDGHQHALHRAQGRQNLWMVSSILAQENWRDLCTLGNGVADEIAKVIFGNSHAQTI